MKIKQTFPKLGMEQKLLLTLFVFFSTLLSPLAEALKLGNLIYNSAARDAVLQLNPATGAISTNAQVSLSANSGLVVAPNGEIIVMHPIGGYTPHPEFIRINPTTGEQQILPNFALMDDGLGMDMAPDGTLIVAGHAPGYAGLFIVNPANGQQTLLVTNNHSLLGAIAVGQQGQILVCENWIPAPLLCFNSDGSNRRTICNLGALVSGVQVGGLALGPSGHIFATVVPTHAVVRVDINTGSQEIISSGNNLTWPTGISVGPNGDVFVCDIGSKKLLKIDPTTGEQVVIITNQAGAHQIRFVSNGFPDIGIRLFAGTATLTWTKLATNFFPEAAFETSQGTFWLPVTNSPNETLWQKEVSLPSASERQFFRLRKSP